MSTVIKTDERPKIEIVDYFWNLCDESSLEELKNWKDAVVTQKKDGIISTGEITNLLDDIIDFHIQALEENIKPAYVNFILSNKRTLTTPAKEVV